MACNVSLQHHWKRLNIAIIWSPGWSLKKHGLNGTGCCKTCWFLSFFGNIFVLPTLVLIDTNRLNPSFSGSPAGAPKTSVTFATNIHEVLDHPWKRKKHLRTTNQFWGFRVVFSRCNPLKHHHSKHLWSLFVLPREFLERHQNLSWHDRDSHARPSPTNEPVLQQKSAKMSHCRCDSMEISWMDNPPPNSYQFGAFQHSEIWNPFKVIPSEFFPKNPSAHHLLVAIAC